MSLFRRSIIPVMLLWLALMPAYAQAQSIKGKGQERQLAAVQRQVQSLKVEARKSQNTINFWYSKEHRWTLYLNHSDKKCWEVPLRGPERLCSIARGAVRFHTLNLLQLKQEIWDLKAPWCKGLSGNRFLGCRMAYEFWPLESEWDALDELWEEESEWDVHANNPTSDACGIPQAMNNCSYGYDPKVQIIWGLNYIRYERLEFHSPSEALRVWKKRKPHWY